MREKPDEQKFSYIFRLLPIYRGSLFKRERDWEEERERKNDKQFDFTSNGRAIRIQYPDHPRFIASVLRSGGISSMAYRSAVRGIVLLFLKTYRNTSS